MIYLLSKKAFPYRFCIRYNSIGSAVYAEEWKRRNNMSKITVIGAGSVVTKSIPSGVVAVGVPCKVMRKITEEDKNRYPVFGQD